MITRLLAGGLLSIAAALALAAPVQATTINFTGAGPTPFDYEPVPQTYGDSAEADLSYRTLTGGNNWGQSATQSADHVDYWTQPNYSGDQAIFSAASNGKLELALQAGSGLAFTSVTFDLGSYPNATRSIAYRLYNAGWTQILSNASLSIDGTTGALVTLAVNTTALYFQMGDDWNTGIRSLTFQTAAVTATPIPPALLLFVTALGGLGFTAWRRKRLSLS